MSSENSNINDNNNNHHDEIEDEDLFLFGYGSLLFKQNFEFLEAFPSYIKGYTRVFYQGSTDHRGVPGSPGRVVTLLPATETTNNNTTSSSSSASFNTNNIVHGLTFRVAKEKAPEVIAKLDIREKNGYDQIFLTSYYHRVVRNGNSNSEEEDEQEQDESPVLGTLQQERKMKRLKLEQTEKNEGEENNNNTNFKLPAQHSVVSTKCLCYIANEHNEEYLGDAGGSMMEIAKQIVNSAGASGKNIEYLLKLGEGLRALCAPDDHCYELERLALQIMQAKEE